MNSALERPLVIEGRLKRAVDSSLLARRLREAECRGDVLFDIGSRGRYATDASIYQIDPIGVVVPCATRTTFAPRLPSRASSAFRCCRAARGRRNAGRRSAMRW